jgi:putative sterol carrier protein
MAYTDKPTDFFKTLASGLTGDLNLFEGIDGVIEFTIEGDDGGVWTLDVPNKRIDEGDVQKLGKKADMLVRAQARDFMALVEGRMSAHDGILTQRLHVAGDAKTLTQVISKIEAIHSDRAA